MRTVLCLYLASLALGSHFEKYDAIKLSRSKIDRARLRWKRRRSSRVSFSDSHYCNGSRITFSPSDENLSKWFWSSRPIEFNRDDRALGFTDPFLQRDMGLRDNASVVIPVSIQSESSALPGRSKAPSTSPKPLEDWWPYVPEQPGWKTLRYRQQVGRGISIYHKVRDAALHWEFEKGPQGIRRVKPKPLMRAHPKFQGRGFDAFIYQDAYTPALESSNVMAVSLHDGDHRNLRSQRLATYTKLLKGLLTCVNPVAVVYNHIDQGVGDNIVSSTAYATCARHWLCGEERVSVLYRRDSEAVDVEIVSVSRAAPGRLGRLIWPFVGSLQERFFKAQLEYLEKIAEGSS